MARRARSMRIEVTFKGREPVQGWGKRSGTGWKWKADSSREWEHLWGYPAPSIRVLYPVPRDGDTQIRLDNLSRVELELVAATCEDLPKPKRLNRDDLIQALRNRGKGI